MATKLGTLIWRRNRPSLRTLKRFSPSFANDSEYHRIADNHLQDLFDHLSRVEDTYDLDVSLSVRRPTIPGSLRPEFNFDIRLVVV